MKYDFAIIGAGIIGLSTAWRLQRRNPLAKILLLEKERQPAQHQSGHNSGVIHAGVYYPPGSLKAQFCKEGAAATYEFCKERGIACEQTGKLLVATSADELNRMHRLFEQCQMNGLDPELLDARQLAEIEPRIRGTGAFRVRVSGITDFPSICREMSGELRERGAVLRFSSEVTEITESASEMTIRSGGRVYTSAHLIVCAGLMSDRMVRLQELGNDFSIIPFRGEYYRLRPDLNGLIDHLIYPIPDPALPFLGIHLTRLVDGTVVIGPNAVTGWKREGYGRLNLSLHDTVQILGFPGFWRLVSGNLRHAARETWLSLSKRAYLKQVQKYCPSLTVKDLLPHPAGIRAQAVMRNGEMIHDFLFRETARSLHVCNAPSPAATCAIPIGNYVCDKLADKISG